MHGSVPHRRAGRSLRRVQGSSIVIRIAVLPGDALAQRIGTAPAHQHCHTSPSRRILESVMLYWSATFFIIALIAAIFGFGGIAVSLIEIAKILFFIFIVLFVVSAIMSLVARRRLRGD